MIDCEGVLARIMVFYGACDEEMLKSFLIVTLLTISVDINDITI